MRFMCESLNKHCDVKEDALTQRGRTIRHHSVFAHKQNINKKNVIRLNVANIII